MAKKLAPRHMRYKDSKRRRQKKKEYLKKPGPRRKPGPKPKRKPKKKPRMGRLDYPEIRKGIIDAVTLGNYIDIAAEAMEVSTSHLYDWLRQAKKDRREKRRNKYTTFSDSLRKALADAEIGDVTRLAAAAAAGPKFWKAAAHKLARRSPRRWGDKSKVEVTGSLEINDLYPIIEKVVEVARNYIKPSDHPAFAADLRALVPDEDRGQDQSGDDIEDVEALLD